MMNEKIRPALNSSFRIHRSSFLLFQKLFPLGVNRAAAGLVRALVCVRAEEVALRLREIEREFRRPVGVEVADGGRHAGRGDARLHRGGDGPPPVTLRALDVSVEFGVEQKVRQVGAAVVGLLDLAEEPRADNAAALPDARALAEVDAPVEMIRAGLDEIHPLRVGANLRGVERVVDGRDHLLAVARVLAVLRPFDLLALLAALVLARGDVARVNGGVNRRRDDAEVEGDGTRPLARALLPGLVENQINEWLAGLRVFDAQDFRRDLDEERFEVAAVPLVEHVGHLQGRHAEDAPHHVVAFGDELHVAVLDAVVHHLDVVARAARPDVCDARAVVNLGGDGLPDGTYLLVGLPVAARHQGRPPQRALLAAGDAGADEVEALRLQLLLAALGVHEVGVAAVNDDVALVEIGLDLLDRPVNRIARLDQKDDLAWALQSLDVLFGRA